MKLSHSHLTGSFLMALHLGRGVKGEDNNPCYIHFTALLLSGYLYLYNFTGCGWE